MNYTTVQKILGIPDDTSRTKETTATTEEEKPELTDFMILRLAQQITFEEEFRVLATKGLRVPYHRLQASLYNHCFIQMAAHETLREWSISFENRKMAYLKLCEALRETNMSHHIRALENDDD